MDIKLIKEVKSESKGIIKLSETTEVVLEAVNKYIEYDKMLKQLNKQMDIWKDSIKKYMLDSNIEKITWEGGEIMLVEDKRMVFDTQRFKAENPDVYNNYLKVSRVDKLIVK